MFDSDIYNQKYDKFYILTYITFIVCVALLICSQCSPFYPMNTWVDVNCYMTIGLGILDGKMPYLDLYDHKGPILYYLHAFAIWLSSKDYLGVFFLELVSGVVFFYYAYKILLLYKLDKAMALLPILVIVVYCSKAFGAGDSAEELCFGFMEAVLYFNLKNILQHNDFDKFVTIFSGIICAFVFWIKFTMVGFFIGMVIYWCYFYYRINKVERILKYIKFFLLGFIIVSLPIILWFMYKNSLTSMLEVYFYDNLFKYNLNSSIRHDGILYSLFWGFMSCLLTNYVVVFFISYGLIFLYKRKRKGLLFIVVTLMVTFFVNYAGGRRYFYYAFIFSVYGTFGLCYINDLLESLKQRTIAVVTLMCFISGLYLFNCNADLLFKNKNDMPQLKLYRKLDASHVKSLRTVNMMDHGFYYLYGIVPNRKEFCKNNMTEITESLDNIDQKKEYYYIICPEKRNFKNYRLLEQSFVDYLVPNFSFYLYEIKNDL